MISPVIVITHAAFDERRRPALARLLGRLRSEAPGVDVRVAEDAEKRGSLWCWRRALDMGLETAATHIVWLPDDAIVCDDFGRILTAAIAARPHDVFDCFVSSRAGAEVPTLWYSTPDGYVGVGGVMPRQDVIDHLAWRDVHPELGGWPNDAGVNLWLHTKRRMCFKTAYSLVQHDDGVPSIDGHDRQASSGHERVGLRPIATLRRGEDITAFLERTYGAPDHGVRSGVTPVGRTYMSNHLELLSLSPPDLESYWWAEGQGLGVSAAPRVYIAMPNQGSIKAAVVQAVLHEMLGLAGLGVDSTLDVKVHDSLITRARDRLVGNFLSSQATHLLFWDSDIVPAVPGFIKKLLDTGLPFVGGAAPFKSDGGRVVCVLDEKRRRPDRTYDAPLVSGCVEVRCVGTGIMLLARETVARLCKAHMDKMYVSHIPGLVHRAEWALFQDSVRGKERLSEDWELCARWQDIGERVFVHPDLEFIHMGERAYTGSFRAQYPLA